MSKTLEMNEPDTRNRLDDMAGRNVGAPMDRPDGPAKVAGAAPYAAEYVIDNVAEGVLVTAPFARGTITSIDERSITGMDGVIAVISDERLTARPAQGTANETPVQTPLSIAYFGQPFALVVAETFEQARNAAKALKFDYSADDPSEIPFDPEAVEAEENDATRQGDLDKAMADAAHSVDITYYTEGHASAAMEPHAAIAEWDGERLTVHASLQMPNYNITELADSLNLEEDNIRILSRYVGGGFGSKLGVSQETVAASIAAMKLGRPVRVVMSRQQVFQTVMRRSETKQRLRLAADKDGRLTGFGHEALVSNLPEEDFAEPVTQASAFLYPGKDRELLIEVARIHRMTAGSVRAPGEAVGMQTLEAAMDELAEKLELDPVELRLRNIPDEHPASGLPYSSRKMEEALKQGAEAFGWHSGPRKPRQKREGEWWIGTGMATAARIHNVGEAEARVTLNGDGTVLVETDMTDIGTGTYSILTQIAADMLGVEPAKVLVDLGDTNHPRGPGSGGSWGAASSGSSVFIACEAVRKAIAEKLGVEEADLELSGGTAKGGGQEKLLSELAGNEGIAKTGTFKPGDAQDDYAMASYGAFFSEVAVNRWTGEARVRRMLGAFGFGRVLNAKTARSQCIGGMTWCIGAALTESLLFDPVDGHVVNCDLAEYHVPVHRDVPHLDVLMIEERDPAASPIQAKGVGELGICGGAGAIANAIYNACGARLYEFPMTPDRIIAAMPED
ncbi:xanthine dehydrogenase family protein molybdopterin-binding subunit [Qipengyuania atrilutea]|uniref:Xanthine dehydrogenase family protein molybdopterin-binding subunit n=1 Tax=Qipengyuania atrilutea TaxID=2744473 RepID=A0A850H218_9SPHN|nr:xanthine dehydrogenase family protein molybdopterin-binding subunit [Actirhodobacter atriluteus]NVD44726.1 xanthine dehydrogenase family protein molybdopterin-binding subunit [Actirhodobacter atriluteus]